MSAVCGATFCSRKKAYQWDNLFKEGWSSVEDEDRPGRPTEVKSPKVIKTVNDLIQSNRRVTVDEIARTLSIFVETAHKIVHDDFGYSNVSCRWVPVRSSQSSPVQSVQTINELGWELLPIPLTFQTLPLMTFACLVP